MLKPFISVIITNKNAFKWLDKCLASLESQTYRNFEVLFVDNLSTDGSTEYVEKSFPWVQVIRNKIDLGFAGANNIGVKRAKGVYVFLMNTDAFLETDTLSKLASVLINNPEYHLMQLDEKKYDKSDLPDRYLIFSMDIFGYPVGTNGKGPIFYADGAALVATRKLFMQLNGFDEDFYMYLEDMDLSWRARIAGEKVYFLKNIYVYHSTGGTSVPTIMKGSSYTTTSSRRFHAQKNNLRSIIKNYSLANILWALPISLLLASAEGFLYLWKGNLAGFIALHKAIWWNIVHLSETLKERAYVQRLRRIHDSVIMKNMRYVISKLGSIKHHGIPNMKI